MSPTETLQAALAEYRRGVSLRRSCAFTDCPESVLGLPVQPITSPSWTRLHSTRSRFLQPGATPLEGDVRNFLWFHSRLFTSNPLLKRPARWLALLRFSAILHQRRDDAEWYAACIALATADIRRIIADTIADVPAPGQSSAPGPALEAQMIHFCAEHYRWTPAFTRRQPLRQLFQLRRCLDTTEVDDAGEREIRFAHLRRRNAELQAAREATPASSL